MNQHLKTIQDFLQQNKTLSDADKEALLKSIVNADKQWSITEFKLDRTEKVKKTTAILLEETIDELEQKRKAVEAQNKELEIESSLEKVRSRSLAMLNSNELRDVVKIVFEKLQELDFAIDGAVFILTYPEDSKEVQSWIGDNLTEYPNCFKMSYYETPSIKDVWDAKKSGVDFFSRTYSFEEKNHWFRYAFEHTDIRSLGDELKNWILQQEFLTQSIALAKNSIIGIHFHQQKLLSEKEIEILKRFSKVFDQAYTRFLDLQKAEAQTREAKIEASLERTRTQSMLMQHSKELDDTLRVFHEQVLLLGIDSAFSFLWLPDEKNDRHIFWAAWAESNSTIFSSKAINYPLDRNEPATALCLADWKGDEPVVSYHVPSAGVENYFAAWSELIAGVDELKPGNFRDGLCYVEAFMKYGCFGVMTSVDLTKDKKKILARFAVEFERTYTRFLDLQKAEAQAKESQVQLALERVRARTMAMHQSGELADTASVLFQQIKELGFEMWSCGFCIWKQNDFAEAWMGAESGGLLPPMLLPYKEEPTHRDIYEASLKGEAVHEKTWEGEALAKHYEFMLTIPSVKKAIDQLKKSGLSLPAKQCYYVGFFKQGYLLLITKEPKADAVDLTKRFAGVFDQTYTRFLDLKKAEAQAREAQIEAALEKVRSRSLAMHKAEELGEVVTVVVEKMRELTIPVNDGVAIVTPIEGSKDQIEWLENPGFPAAIKFYQPYYEHPILADYWKAKSEGIDFIAPKYTAEESRTFLHHIFEHTDYKNTPQEIKDYCLAAKSYAYSAFFQKNSSIFINDYSERSLTGEEVAIVKRFSKVFEQAYVRFLDLQKAEAQAREAQIEAALEKVRSRSLAMHKSDELEEVIMVVSEQLLQLQFRFHNVSFSSTNEQRETTFWLATPGRPHPFLIQLPYIDTTMLTRVFDARKNSIDFFADTLTAGENQEWLQHLVYKSRNSFTEEDKKYLLTLKGLARSTVLTKNIILAIINYAIVPYSEEQNFILRRFGNVFEQAYTRFLDLQKAEAQAREAQIEGALERVRSRTMGMQKSEELKEVIRVVYEQFTHLNIPVEHTGFIIDYKERDDMHIWLADVHKVPFEITIPYFDSPHWNSFNEAKATGRDFFINVLDFEGKNEFYRNLFQHIPGVPEETKDYYFTCRGLAISTVLLDNVGLYIENFSGIPYTEEENATLRRFGKVFQQTYTRFLDLQKAEAQALEAIKRASVDRIRAEIASMRTTKDLERIQPLIWNELTTLGIPFIRCGVFIMDEEQQLVHTFLSTPEGKAIATLHVPFGFGLSIIANGVSYWRKKEMYKEYWDATTFTKSWTELSSLSQASGNSHQQEQSPENLYLHMLPFIQGMLYVGNDTPLNEVELQVVQNLANAFATAYARYEDFNKLESANIKIEKTLVDLKQAQAQLVQSEKMASLGELTAGIAHEIQNPLNFVNNFSDVNTELIEELKNELKEGNTEEVIAIANDIKANEEKINHHGKRADAIVKGMLQHSRSTGNVKEPTDINVLADEYLRLAYHGLRAKDKAFNATLKTDYDETIGKINIIPQDIGRAILNVITNAFYAVNERQKQNPPAYEPLVRVSTKRTGNTVSINVSDNGNGIPAIIVDKVFQPFFTTKPTGQGTGLGLSLAYDIVKAHGGELKVKTKEGEGSEFIIQLQNN